MNEQQRTILHLALRMLGDPNWNFNRKEAHIHGVICAAINLRVDIPALSEIFNTVSHLKMETLFQEWQR